MPHVEIPQAEFKVVILGDSHVGKTSLVTRFAEGYYRENSRQPTVGAFFVTKRITSTTDAVATKIQIWDTAGQDNFRPMAPMFYKDAAAVIVCYDVTRRESFEGMRRWLDEVRGRVKVGEDVIVAIAALKTDLLTTSNADMQGGATMVPRAVPEGEVEQLAEALGVIYLPTSAKTDTNVQALFQCVADRVLQTRKNASMVAQQKHGGDLNTLGGSCLDERINMSSTPRKRDQYDRYYSSNNNTAQNGGSDNSNCGNSTPFIDEGNEPTSLDRRLSNDAALSGGPRGNVRSITPSTEGTATSSLILDGTTKGGDGGASAPAKGNGTKNGKRSNKAINVEVDQDHCSCQPMACGAVGDGSSGCTVQ